MCLGTKPAPCARTLRRALRFFAGLGLDLPKLSARSDLRERGQSSCLAPRAPRRAMVGGDGLDPAHWAVSQLARQPASKIDGAPPCLAETERGAVWPEIRAQRPHLPPERENVPVHRQAFDILVEVTIGTTMWAAHGSRSVARRRRASDGAG